LADKHMALKGRQADDLRGGQHSQSNPWTRVAIPSLAFPRGLRLRSHRNMGQFFESFSCARLSTPPPSAKMIA
jgi:hypothetical protein